MLQRSQIGKSWSKKAQAEAKLNRVYITPNGDNYMLVKFEKVGRSYHYIYEWVNCSDSILEKTTNRVRSKVELSVSDIMNWITELKSL